jgi:CheY-like chemotaxis protein
MDAIGRLAGGVAHDFNNILQSIIGYGELLLDKLSKTDEAHEFADEILSESKRAIALTRHLLTFARKQVIDPKVFDLNVVVSATLKMLNRLVGESIELEWHPDADRCYVKMDATQVDQILTNLTVNARDALDGVGKVVIETGTEVLDERQCLRYPGLLPSRYITLSVTDGGCGMERATLDRLFEPFFTTKERGKGTGLGLATVYGIVKQNQGYISVQSTPGHGSTFKIYLPEHAAPTDHVEEPVRSGNVSFGHETVLVVDDEESLLRAGRRMLETLGYVVLAAAGPDEALRLVKSYPNEIHVLLTDVVMPGMSGRDLWRKIERMRPTMKCIYMSGFTANIIAQRNALDRGVNFLQKPFTKTALGNKVHEVLSAVDLDKALPSREEKAPADPSAAPER